MAGAKFLMAGYQRFVADKSMLKRLYGEEDFDSANSQEDINDESKDFSAKDTLRAKIEKKKDFKASYFLYTLISYFKCLCCCCCAPCCRVRCKRYIDSHKKFEIAQ